MAEMSRIHDALGHRKAPQKPNDAGQPPGQLGWAPRSKSTRRREGHGPGRYLFWGVLIGGLVSMDRDRVVLRDPSGVEQVVALDHE